MAFKLGQAIVEFRAKGVNAVTMAGRKATRTLNEMSRAATGVALSLSAGALTAAGVAAIKLAANVETTRVQFEVLTKSADKANQLLGEITDLAASTPFQKMELADAGRKLLAFGSSADQVVGQLRQIGDIAALTGINVSELAEIYGKAQVQGRLFAEDINQLTGRGIPIIEELAKQFGVSTEEVKKLVSEGRVGFAQLEEAFADMTSQGGLFENGMAKLSETTAGKLSTLKDNLTEIAVTIGEQVLPAVNRMVDTMLEAFRAGGPLSRSIETLIDKLALMADMVNSIEWEGINAGINLNKVEENEAARLRRQQRDVIQGNKDRFRELERQREQEAAKDQAKARVPAVPLAAGGFHDAGRFDDAMRAFNESRGAGLARSSRFGFAQLAGSITESSLNRSVELQQKANDKLGEAVDLLGGINDGIDNIGKDAKLG